jgi:hypothetical protein
MFFEFGSAENTGLIDRYNRQSLIVTEAIL